MGQPGVVLQGSSNSTNHYCTSEPTTSVDALSSATQLQPAATPTQTTVYTLHAGTDATHCGAEAASSMKVTVYDKIVIPNTFSPNAKGLNELGIL